MMTDTGMLATKYIGGKNKSLELELENHQPSGSSMIAVLGDLHSPAKRRREKCQSAWLQEGRRNSPLRIFKPRSGLTSFEGIETILVVWTRNLEAKKSVLKIVLQPLTLLAEANQNQLRGHTLSLGLAGFF